MQNKIYFFLSLTISSAFLFIIFPANSYAATLEVGAGRTYSTIQAAVNASVAGDTVLVYPGTYNENVFIPDGKQGGATTPIIIKALYPARKPLDSGVWADTTDKRSVVNAGNGYAAFYNNGPQSRPPVQNLIIDGFYITGGGQPIPNWSNGAGCAPSCPSGGIFFAYDNNIWIRNNVIINSNPYRIYNPNGEAAANVYLVYTGDYLIQNNYFEYTDASPYITSAFFFAAGGVENVNGILEYNEGYIGPDAQNGAFAYVRLRTTGFVFRYNYYHRAAGSISINTMLSRFRDHTGTIISNNFFRSDAVIPWFWINNQPEVGALIENHKLNRNTFYSEQGITDTRHNFALSQIDDTEVSNNIFYSGTYDANSYSVGEAFINSPSRGIIIDQNIYYNFLSLVEPALGGYTETNTLNTNPNINAATGCASSVSNNTYGANLNVSNIPYRKCDGAFYSATGKFGITVTVSDGGGADITPPSAPTGLAVN